MSGVIIANKDETISISAPDIYGAEFKLSLFSQTDNAWVLSSQPMSEYQDIFTVNNQTISLDGVEGDTEVNISGVLGVIGFIVEDIINIKNFSYRIIKVSENIITIHTGLKEDILVGDIANRVGNMSLYYIQLNIAVSGDYLIRAKDSIHGLDITDSLKVVPKSIETMVKDIKNLEYAILGQ